MHRKSAHNQNISLRFWLGDTSVENTSTVCGITENALENYIPTIGVNNLQN
jgi:hypothetical protein